MKQVFAPIILVMMLGTSAMSQDRPECPQPGHVIFPLGEVIEKAGLSLEFDFSDLSYPAFGTPTHVAQIRRHVLANLEGKSQAERDALLLGRLSWSTIGTIPLLGITTMPDAGQFDDYLDVLMRHGLEEHAKALRNTRAAFPIWNASAQNRHEQWSDGRGGILNPVLDAALRRESAAFKAAKPSLLEAAEDILSSDPSYGRYLDQREDADDWQKHAYLMAQVGACLEAYRTPEQADAALSRIDPTLADFHVLDMFLLEAGNGGMHQYIFNSTGMLATQLQDVLSRWALPQQAKAVTDTLNYFPMPYPRDTQARRAVMTQFDTSTDDAVNAGTWIADDPAVWDKIRDIAITKEYWPK